MSACCLACCEICCEIFWFIFWLLVLVCIAYPIALLLVLIWLLILPFSVLSACCEAVVDSIESAVKYPKTCALYMKNRQRLFAAKKKSEYEQHHGTTETDRPGGEGAGTTEQAPEEPAPEAEKEEAP
ncbi:uncharacterized protein [Ptychodera flava]|uniref:uncharacterized protein n=1 Tax=Ptychodera flava TaxID=63121 RepID=UPI003969F3FA